ncbi:MAG: NADH:flavin oxidoreductase, partial [Planctomycetaceae bacterium]|nr:NADH:flavin oxidoreductase [Planctomycetaceae bacterium]
MAKFPFLNSYDELQSELMRLGLEIPVEDDFSVLAEPLSFCYRDKTRTFPNRFVVQPMEGFDSGQNGEPTALSFRRYERFAGGGAGLI